MLTSGSSAAGLRSLGVLVSDTYGYTPESGVVTHKETSSAPTATATYGSFWVSGATPNVPMFTDDAGTSVSLIAGTGTVTSVGISGTDGIDVDTGTPITTAGTITLGLSNIANSKLANSSVSYGGVSLSLGGTDATPAFNLSDATAYPGDTSLVTLGTITTGVWQGTAIANSYLANDSVSYGGVSVDLGATDDTPAFDLSDATGYPASGSDTYVQFNDGGSFGGSANFVWDGTNVGIGTDSPTEKLHVVGNSLLNGTVHASGASFQKSLGEVLYVRNALNTFDINAILQHSPNIQYVKPDPTSVPGVSVIPTELPLAEAENVGLEITVVQDWSADPTAALSVQKQTHSSDVIYEGGSNSASATVSISAYRGANKTFMIAAAGIWIVIN